MVYHSEGFSNFFDGVVIELMRLFFHVGKNLFPIPFTNMMNRSINIQRTQGATVGYYEQDYISFGIMMKSLAYGDSEGNSLLDSAPQLCVNNLSPVGSICKKSHRQDAL
jgi:hypothetical protein